MERGFAKSWLVAGAAVGALWSGAAWAQTQTDAGFQLEEVVVTAQRRSERLQDTPVSVTALTTKALEARGVSNLQDIGNFAPSLEIHQTNRPAGGSSAFAAYIRGVGTGDFQFPTDPGVGLYVDDVYIARSVGGLLSLEDIARVEVLKGPQGTLYGRNTIGGAINVVTTQPVLNGDVTGQMKVKVGSYGRADIVAALNGPIVQDKLGGKFSVSFLNSDGFGRSNHDPQNLNSEGRLIFRGGLRYQASPDLTFSLSGDYTRQRQRPPAGVVLGFAPAGSTLTKIAKYNQYAAPYWNARLGLPSTTRYDASIISNGDYRNNDFQRQYDNSDIGGVAGVIDWRPSEAFGVKSISAARVIAANIKVDGDHSPYPLQDSATDLYSAQISEELQISGKMFDDRLIWLVGAYAFRETGSSKLNTLSFDGLYEAEPVKLAADAGDTFTYFHMQATSYAVFTQNTLVLTPGLNLTVGARYNHDEKDYAYSVDFTQRRVPQVPLSNISRDWDSFTPKVGLDWKPSDDVMLYASYSKGFKSGGFSTSNSATDPTPVYNPEKLASREIGAKTSWLDNRLTANFAAYASTYEDIQLTVQGKDAVTGANLRKTENAGEAHIKGFEAELIATPARGLTANLGVGYTKARFHAITADATTAGVKVGDHLPQIPNWSVNGGVEYGFSTSLGDVSLRGDFTYKGDQFLTLADPTSYQKAYALYNARISFTPTIAPNLELSVEGVNLSDKVYYAYLSTLAPTGEYVGIPIQPRMIYATARLRF